MLFVAKKGGCVWMNGVHGNRGPGYRPMCKGDLWPLGALLFFSRYNCQAELYVYAVRRYDSWRRVYEQWESLYKEALGKSKKGQIRLRERYKSHYHEVHFYWRKGSKEGSKQIAIRLNSCQLSTRALSLVCTLAALYSGLNQSTAAIRNPLARLLASAEFHESACPKDKKLGWNLCQRIEAIAFCSNHLISVLISKQKSTYRSLLLSQRFEAL